MADNPAELEFCPKCDSMNVSSDYGGPVSQLMGYSDVMVDGIPHYHNGNKFSERFWCLDCHAYYQYSWYRQCIKCDWIKFKGLKSTIYEGADWNSRRVWENA